MTTDLPPDVRAEAVHAARGEWMRHGARWDTVVDAVTAVVAPEIGPLQARIAELEAAERDRKQQFQDLSWKHAQVVLEVKDLRPRVELLAAALKKVTDYFASAPALMSTGQWEALSDARAALAAGEASG